MNIVYATSDLYSRPALISIKSLLENNTSANEINIFYLENKITEYNKALLQRLVSQYSRKIEFIKMPDRLRNIGGLMRTNPIVYSYCYFHDILPANIDKVLLLEADAIVTGDIHQFFEIDIDEYYLAVTDDFQSVHYKKKLGMKPGSVYFNSGIMMYNLKKWRADNLTNKITNIIKNGQSKFFYEVQDELNVLLESQVLILPPKFNSTTAIFVFDYRDMLKYRQPSTKCSEYEYYCARKNPLIVHFTKNQIIQSRPWVKGCTHPYNEYYLQMKNETELYEEPLWEEHRNFLNKIVYSMYKTKLKTILAYVLGVVHAVLYPTFLYKFRKR